MKYSKVQQSRNIGEQAICCVLCRMNENVWQTNQVLIGKKARKSKISAERFMNF